MWLIPIYKKQGVSNFIEMAEYLKLNTDNITPDLKGEILQKMSGFAYNDGEIEQYVSAFLHLKNGCRNLQGIAPEFDKINNS